jgi:hypothetical protein
VTLDFQEKPAASHRRGMFGYLREMESRDADRRTRAIRAPNALDLSVAPFGVPLDDSLRYHAIGRGVFGDLEVLTAVCLPSDSVDPVPVPIVAHPAPRAATSVNHKLLHFILSTPARDASYRD